MHLCILYIYLLHMECSSTYLNWNNNKKSEQHHTYITTSNQNVKTEKALNCVFKPELGTRYEMSL